MTFCITIATGEFWFFRTICSEVSSLLTTTTRNHGQKLLCEGFVAFFGVMTFLSTLTSVHRHLDGGKPAIATTIVPGRTFAGHMTSLTTYQFMSKEAVMGVGILAITTDHSTAEVLSFFGTITHTMSLLSTIDTTNKRRHTDTFYHQHRFNHRTNRRERFGGGVNLQED